MSELKTKTNKVVLSLIVFVVSASGFSPDGPIGPKYGEGEIDYVELWVNDAVPPEQKSGSWMRR